MIDILILSTAIGISVSRSPAAEQESAYRALAKATYISSGTNKKVKNIEKNVIPQSIREYGGWIAGMSRLMIEKKISFEWTF